MPKLFVKNDAKSIRLTLISNLPSIEAIANHWPFLISEEPIRFISTIRLVLQ